MLIGGAERAAHLQPSLGVQCLCCRGLRPASLSLLPRSHTPRTGSRGDRVYNEITHLRRRWLPSGRGSEPKHCNNRKKADGAPAVKSRQRWLPRNTIPALMSLKRMLGGTLDRLSNPSSQNARGFLLSSASFFFVRVLYFVQAAVSFILFSKE